MPPFDSNNIHADFFQTVSLLRLRFPKYAGLSSRVGDTENK